MKIIKQSSLQPFITPNAVVTPLATERLGSEQISVIRQVMEAGHHNPTHTQTTEELMVMLEGVVTVTVDGSTSLMAAGDTLIVPANTPHSIHNTSDRSATWLIVSPVGMEFHGPDGSRMSPDWAR